LSDGPEKKEKKQKEVEIIPKEKQFANYLSGRILFVLFCFYGFLYSFNFWFFFFFYQKDRSPLSSGKRTVCMVKKVARVGKIQNSALFYFSVL